MKKSHIFRTKSTKHRFGDFPIISQEIYVSDDVRDYILQSDLTGFTFYEVWSSQEAEASVEELNPFVRESLDEDVEAHLQAYYGPIIRRVEAESAEVTEAGFMKWLLQNQCRFIRSQHMVIVRFACRHPWIRQRVR